MNHRDAAIRAWLTSRTYPESVGPSASEPEPPRVIRVVDRRPPEPEPEPRTVRVVCVVDLDAAFDSGSGGETDHRGR